MRTWSGGGGRTAAGVHLVGQAPHTQVVLHRLLVSLSQERDAAQAALAALAGHDVPLLPPVPPRSRSRARSLITIFACRKFKISLAAVPFASQPRAGRRTSRISGDSRPPCALICARSSASSASRSGIRGSGLAPLKGRRLLALGARLGSDIRAVPQSQRAASLSLCHTRRFHGGYLSAGERNPLSWLKPYASAHRESPDRSGGNKPMNGVIALVQRTRR